MRRNEKGEIILTWNEYHQPWHLIIKEKSDKTKNNKKDE